METQSSRYKTPFDYLKLFFRRKWLVVIPAFIGLVGGIVACFWIPPRWESSTIILVEDQKIINPLIQDLAVSTTAVQRMQSIREIILGWNSLVELTQKLDLAKGVNSQLGFEKMIANLRKNINVQMTGSKQQGIQTSNIIRISYEGNDPKITQKVTQSLTDILMEKNLAAQTKETDVAIQFITDQLAIYKRKIKESEIAKMEEQLKALLQDSTEQHPMVRELRGKIAIAKKELESGEYEVKGENKVVDEATKKALKEELDKIIAKDSATQPVPGGAPIDPNNAIYKLLLMDKVDASMARDMNVNEATYNMLLQKLETAKITQRLEASKEGTRYTILDPPRLPLTPVKPNKPLVILMGLLLGAASGVGLAFAREFTDQSILDIEDAKATLSMPVLGAISRITTQEEIQREKIKTQNTAIILGVASLALIIASALIYFFVRR